MATETRSPGTLADDSGTGTVTWSNPSNAGASDNSYTTLSGGPGAISHYLKGTNFGFTTIGDSDTLTQLKLRFERKKSSGGTINDDKVYLVVGGTIQTGTNYADTSTAYPSSDTYAEYTITSGLPTVAELKASGFGFVVSCKDTSGFPWGVDGDHQEVIATYTPAGTIVIPGTLALVLTTFAPPIRLDKIVQPGSRALSLATFAPTVAVSGSPIVTPSTAALVLSTFAPTIRLDKIVQPATRALVTTGFAPTVRLGPAPMPATLALTLTRFAPTILTPQVVRPSTKTLALTTYAPTLKVEREWSIQRLNLRDSA